MLVALVGGALVVDLDTGDRLGSMHHKSRTSGSCSIRQTPPQAGTAYFGVEWFDLRAE
jgi:hypothetical protein